MQVPNQVPDNVFVDKIIPVNPSLLWQAKETIHNFFRRPLVVRILTWLPPLSFLQKYKNLAQLITKCHEVFKESSPSHPINIQVYGGDRLSTLRKLESSRQENRREFQIINTEIKFTTDDCLTAARDMRKNKETVAILNLANRCQAGGVGLAPYGGSQEEFLVRRSNLAWGLDPRFASEKVHSELSKTRAEEGLSEPFQHHIPYFGALVSKNVTFIDQKEYDQFDIISAAAPDMRKGSDEYRYLQKFGPNIKAAQRQILTDKIKAVFEAAIAENIENLVLGAFGCGCFLNDVQEVGQIFSDLLNSDAYKGRFRFIAFSITEKSKLDIFKDTILKT